MLNDDEKIKSNSIFNNYYLLPIIFGILYILTIQLLSNGIVSNKKENLILVFIVVNSLIVSCLEFVKLKKKRIVISIALVFITLASLIILVKFNNSVNINNVYITKISISVVSSVLYHNVFSLISFKLYNRNVRSLGFVGTSHAFGIRPSIIDIIYNLVFIAFVIIYSILFLV